MSRRIDIELTSDRADGTWTWRAAGAKQPKGVLQADLLPPGAEVGQQLRAEVEASIDGMDVVAVLPPKTKNRTEVPTLELIGRPVRDDELVTSKLAGRGGRDRGDRGDRGDRRDRKDRPGRGDRGPRRDGDRPPRRGEGRGSTEAGDRGRRTDGDRPRGDRPRGDRSDRPRRDRPEAPAKPKPKRLRAGRTHRKAALDALPAAEQVIAEQVLLGGLPAVRQAVDKQNAHARETGGREVAPDALLAVAERLLPDLRAAEWRDKAEAALADLAELDLRDLRSVVVAAETGAKDEASRELATQLRDGLTQRLDAEQTAWLAELTATLDEGRVVRALRLSSRPPKAGAPLPAELATKLTEAAAAALSADTFADRWATVLDALSFSPVRLQVVPVSKPDAPSEELIAVITKMSDRVPQVAQAFGIEPVAPSRRGRGRGGANRSGAPKGAKPPRPPKPPKPSTTPGPTEPTDAEPTEPAAPVAVPTDDVTAAATPTPAPTAEATPSPAAPEPDPSPDPDPAPASDVATPEPDGSDAAPPTPEPAPEAPSSTEGATEEPPTDEVVG